MEHYVLLEPEKKEKIVNKLEAIEWLKDWFSKVSLITINHNADIEQKTNFSELLENTCELEIKPGYVIKWFAVRIDPD